MKRAALALVLCLSFPATAQVVTGVTQLKNKAGEKVALYSMNIDGKPYTAFPEGQAEQKIQELEQLRATLQKTNEELKDYKSLANQYDQLKKDYVILTEKFKVLTDDSLQLSEKFSATAGKLLGLTNDYQKLNADYAVLAEKYRSIALRSAPRQPLDFGVGVVRTGDTNHLVGMAGAGYTIAGDFGVRGWVFGGQSTYGGMLGISF